MIMENMFEYQPNISYVFQFQFFIFQLQYFSYVSSLSGEAHICYYFHFINGGIKTENSPRVPR